MKGVELVPHLKTPAELHRIVLQFLCKPLHTAGNVLQEYQNICSYMLNKCLCKAAKPGR